ncbi:MAG: phosphomannomutase/phosphoglucomutase [Thiohalomonas sp.]|nr:phosphomannomutase/phosphoglucomutase [Thiohalomonas sp.]
MDVEKKGFLCQLVLIFVLLIAALALFYGAAISKESAEKQYLQQLENKAKQDLAVQVKQSSQVLAKKISNFNYILNDAEYIKIFNDPTWQDVLKTDLAARLGEQALVEIVSADFKDDDIIDNPAMGYSILSLLNELKEASKNHSKNDIKIEVHGLKSDDSRLVFIKKATYTDFDLKKEVLIGYIVAKIPKQFIKQLIKEFKTETGYLEIVQRFSGKSLLLVKAGDQSLKNMPMFVSKKLQNTQWIVKFWPVEQTNKPPLSSIWLVIVSLALGSIAIVTSLFFLFIIIKSYKSDNYVVALPVRQKNQIVKQVATTHNSPNITRSEEVTDVIYRKDTGITVDDNSESEYLDLITEKIFRAYDIRGVVGEFINADIFQKIAYGIAKEMSELQQTQISIGCDGRNSSPELVKAIIDALLESGINVLDIGMVTSPILYFSAITKTDGNGLIVTASHNPADYNGIKIMLTGHSYSDIHLQKLKKKVIAGERVSGAGELSQFNILEEYITKITGNVILGRPMNIVIDSANGVTGKFASAFFEQLGCKVTALNSEVDGNFPVHDPDPSRPENMSELIQKVTEIRADIGIAFDGDGDRIGLVSSGGEIIWPDRILMLLAKDILSRNKDATILYDVKSTWKLEKFISELGGNALLCKSGHSFMKSKLLETGALLAGEMSGHIFIKERWFGFDDALFVAARVLEILSIDLRKSRQIFAELPDSLNTPEILIAAENSKAIMEQINKDLSIFSDGKIITIDGIRVEYSDGWGLVRSSNTSENLTMRFEAENEAALQRIAMTFKDAVLTIEPTLEFPF